MNGNQVRILDGNTFVVSDERGDIEASLTDPTGLFSFDTRFLSKWILTVDGQRLTPLSVDDLHYFETQFFLVPGTGTVYVDSKLSVIRHRTVGNGFREQLTFLNHDARAGRSGDSDRRRLRLRRSVRGQGRAPKKGTFHEAGRRQGAGAGATERETFSRETDDLVLGAVRVRRARFDVRGSTRRRMRSWTTTLDVATDLGGRRHDAEDARAWRGTPPPAHEHGGTTWRDGSTHAPRLECDWEPLKATYRRSLVDLAALRFSPLSAGRHTPARRRAAVVHDDVRTRQHLHQPAGAAVHAGAGGDHAARARAAAGHAHRRLPRRGARAGSCTRCATAR